MVSLSIRLSTQSTRVLFKADQHRSGRGEHAAEVIAAEGGVLAVKWAAMEVLAEEWRGDSETRAGGR